MTNENFNFYHELSKQDSYHLLIPDKDIMLVVVKLYQREQFGEFREDNNRFEEDVILECIRSTLKPTQFTLHERDNHIIQQLLDYFLFRDGSSFYSLKPYARELCKLVENRLKDQFNPTETEYYFNLLVDELAKACRQINENPESFNNWVDKVFDKYKSDIEHQIEVLDKKVSVAVTKIRKESTSQGKDFLKTLQFVDNELNTITEQTNELDNVFHSSGTIRRQLHLLQDHKNQEYFGNRIDDVYLFLSNSSGRLRWIRRRIDKIRPRIQRLFTDIKKREFDLKTEKFLGYLLKRSTITRQKHKKTICLPEDITQKTICNQRLKYTFLSQNKKLYLQPKPTKVKRPTINRLYQAKLAQDFQQIQYKYDRLQYWCTQVDEDLRNGLDVTYSSYFFRIVSEDSQGFQIAVELAYYILYQYSGKDAYLLNIGTQAIRDDSLPQYGVYEIEVSKQNV